MKVQNFIEILDADFYAGVPDSQLKALCNQLISVYGIDPKHHLIAANEGNAVALAAGYHLATGKVGVVYMQNSGEGNIINPLASLMSPDVYGIPCLYIVGWRGEPGIHDEPQHVYQGKVSLRLLEDMDIATFVLNPETTEDQLHDQMEQFRGLFAQGKSAAIVVRKGALTDAPAVKYANDNVMTREEIIRHIVAVSGTDPIVSTTGKASRELFELREANGTGHGHDFLTVGSMGHSSSIALELATQKSDARVWCIDGDGAALMHMGAMAVIGSVAPDNLIHIVINNGAHETVGGMPTAARKIDLPAIARGCGYKKVFSAHNETELDRALHEAAELRQLTFIEAHCGIGARADLGRPTTTPQQNKEAFMHSLSAI